MAPSAEDIPMTTHCTLLSVLIYCLLPPAYVVRREGNSFTLLVCPHLRGGYPYPIMLCNISQNAMGQTGGVPCQVQPGGVPWWGETQVRYPPPSQVRMGGVPCQGYSGRVPPGQVRMGGYPARGYSGRVPPQQGTPPAGQVRTGGGTQLGQQKEYSLHGGRYASCVDAGGLSCYYFGMT